MSFTSDVAVYIYIYFFFFLFLVWEARVGQEVEGVIHSHSVMFNSFVTPQTVA